MADRREKQSDWRVGQREERDGRMIVHQTEKIAGSTCGRLEDGWNDKPKVKERENMERAKEREWAG